MAKLLKFEDFEKDRSKQVPAVIDHTPTVPQEPNTMQEPTKPTNESLNTLVWKGVLESTYFTAQEKIDIYAAMKAAGVTNKALNESVLTRMRETLPKLRQDGTEVKEEVIDKLETVMKSSSAFSKYLSDLVLKAWDRALGFYKSKLDPSKEDVNKRIKLLRRNGEDINNNVGSELSALKDVSTFWLKQFPSMVSKSLLQNYSKAIIKESFEVSADIHLSLMKFSPSRLNEQNDALWAFMDEITDQMSSVAPFSTIANVRSFDGIDPEMFADAFIKYTAESGGPAARKYEMFPVVMEEVVRYKNSKLSKDMPEQILKSEGVLKFLPMNKEILTIIEAVAMTIVSIEAMMKNKEDTDTVYKK